MDALRFQPNLFQQVLYPFYPPAGVCITFQVMAVSGQSASDEYSICAFFEGSQACQYIDFRRTRYLHHLYFGGILQAQSTGKIGRGVCTMLTAESQDVKLCLDTHSINLQCWLAMPRYFLDGSSC